MNKFYKFLSFQEEIVCWISLHSLHGFVNFPKPLSVLLIVHSILVLLYSLDGLYQGCAVAATLPSFSQFPENKHEIYLYIYFSSNYFSFNIIFFRGGGTYIVYMVAIKTIWDVPLLAIVDSIIYNSLRVLGEQNSVYLLDTYITKNMTCVLIPWILILVIFISSSVNK